MAKLPYMQFYVADYMLDTQPLSINARGIWVDVLCMMWRNDQCGTMTHLISDWCRKLRCAEADFLTVLVEFSTFDICKILKDDAKGTVSITSRRLAREEKARKKNRLYVKRHRSKTPVRGPSLAHQPENQNQSQNQSHISEEEKNIVGLAPNGAQEKLELVHGWKDAEDLLAFLNERTGKHFQARTPAGQPTKTLTLLRNLLKQRYSPVQIRQVIANRWLKWGQDPKMQEFLRPSTLFRCSNFENYLGELGVNS